MQTHRIIAVAAALALGAPAAASAQPSRPPAGWGRVTMQPMHRPSHIAAQVRRERTRIVAHAARKARLIRLGIRS